MFPQMDLTKLRNSQTNNSKIENNKTRFAFFTLKSIKSRSMYFSTMQTLQKHTNKSTFHFRDSCWERTLECDQVEVSIHRVTGTQNPDVPIKISIDY